MAKGPIKKSYTRKGASPSKGKGVAPTGGKIGGKNLSLYMKNGSFNMPSSPKSGKNRRFSLAQSSSSSSDEESPAAAYISDSNSDSLLTAVSDNDNVAVGRGRGKTGKRVGKAVKGKSFKNFGSKRYDHYDQDVFESSSEEEDDQDSEEDDEDEEEDEDQGSEDEAGSSSSDDEDVDFVKLQAQKKIKSSTPIGNRKKRASGSVPKPKFGRRRSEAPLPEDINFKFEFNESNNDNAIEDESEMSSNEMSNSALDLGETVLVPQLEEEDIGEEIDYPQLQDQPGTEFDLEFNNQLILAPNFKPDDINSDDDYEIDDNELLATLQADNDMEEFNQTDIARQNSIVSMDEDDEEENDFLKEEEKFLVNEFENNGFDEEETTNGYSGIYSSDDALTNFGDDEDDDDEVLDLTLNSDLASPKSAKPIKKEEDSSDDDSYLWNYFFSSDNDSDSEDHKSSAKSPRKKSRKRVSPVPETTFVAMEEDVAFDSSESTDVDENIPTTSTNNLGSQKAKEVLSSKTADYRPPVLGTWVAVESKPFGIIDGLSTRTLNGQAPTIKSEKDRKPRKSVVGTPHSEDSALGLDELFNMSEMDYDDTDDAKIWHDFNNNKKRVPLGAFRNKSMLVSNESTDPLAASVQYNHTSKTNNEYNQRRYSFGQKKKPRRKSNVASVPSKLKRRRASRVEAFAEGYRPTKSGLFSEQALLDVEQVLGEDNDIMALIKGL